MGLRQFIDIGRGNWHLAADADALDEAQQEQHLEVPSKGATHTHDRHQAHSHGGTRHPAQAFSQQPEAKCADDLPKVSGSDQDTDLARR